MNIEKYLLTDELKELREKRSKAACCPLDSDPIDIAKAQLEKAIPLIAREIRADFEKTFEFVDGKLRFILTPEDSVLKSTQARVKEFWERWEK